MITGAGGIVRTTLSRSEKKKNKKTDVFKLYKRYMIILQDTLDTYDKGYIGLEECAERVSAYVLSVCECGFGSNSD